MHNLEGSGLNLHNRPRPPDSPSGLARTLLYGDGAMARPLRIELAGGVYHITSRGNARQKIFLDGTDYRSFFSLLGDVAGVCGWQCYAYCLMPNHYHLVLTTPAGNLSKGMRQLNGVYAQRFHNRHASVGHLFQGRFKSILVDRDSYLLQVCR